MRSSYPPSTDVFSAAAHEMRVSPPEDVSRKIKVFVTGSIIDSSLSHFKTDFGPWNISTDAQFFTFCDLPGISLWSLLLMAISRVKHFRTEHYVNKLPRYFCLWSRKNTWRQNITVHTLYSQNLIPHPKTFISYLQNMFAKRWYLRYAR